MKLTKLQAFALMLILVGSALDLWTTEVLLQIGSVEREGAIYHFSEANPLFHVFGHQNFVAVYIATTAFLAILTLATPKIEKHKELSRIAPMVLALYGLTHLYLGIQNFTIFQQYVGFSNP